MYPKLMMSVNYHNVEERQMDYMSTTHTHIYIYIYI